MVTLYKTTLKGLGGCSCDSVEIVSTRSDVVKKHRSDKTSVVQAYEKLREFP